MDASFCSSVSGSVGLGLNLNDSQDVGEEDDDGAGPPVGLGEREELVAKHDKVYTTLIRDHNGLGFSIAGGRGSSPFRDDSNVS
jgi:hypothetical protein